MRKRICAASVATLAMIAMNTSRSVAQFTADSTSEMSDVAATAAPAIPPGPVKPTWESIDQNYKVPEWFRDAKFGIFMHWGLYSVPAHGSEWYVRYMYANTAFIQWHTEHFGPPDKFGYKDFIPLFTCANSIRMHGRCCSRRRGRSMWCRRQSIMTAGRIGTVI